MRSKRTLVVVLAGAMIAAGLADRPAQAAPDKNQQIAAAFKRARTLYRQGKYEQAIKAFDEVKDLRYHPILDYGMANCYEALRDYNKAIYYLEKYKRNYAKFKMSPKHPKVSDVEEKIKNLKRRAAAGTATPAPGPTPGASTTGTPVSSGGQAGDPVPGPDPYAVPPPPGGGSTGGVYGGGGTPPPPPGYQVRRRRLGPARRSLMVSVDFGAASFAGGGSYSIADGVGTGGGVFGTVAWRFIPWLAVGIHGGVTAMDSDYCDSTGCYTGDTLYFAVGVLEARGILPLGPIDIWGSLGIGYGQVGQPLDNYNTISVTGPTLAVALGLDWFLSRTFSIGLLARIYKIFPTKWCGPDSCGDLPSDTDPGIAWYGGLAVTWHYPLMFGHRR